MEVASDRPVEPDKSDAAYIADVEKATAFLKERGLNEKALNHFKADLKEPDSGYYTVYDKPRELWCFYLNLEKERLYHAKKKALKEDPDREVKLDKLEPVPMSAVRKSLKARMDALRLRASFYDNGIPTTYQLNQRNATGHPLLLMPPAAVDHDRRTKMAFQEYARLAKRKPHKAKVKAAKAKLSGTSVASERTRPTGGKSQLRGLQVDNDQIDMVRKMQKAFQGSSLVIGDRVLGLVQQTGLRFVPGDGDFHGAEINLSSDRVEELASRAQEMLQAADPAVKELRELEAFKGSTAERSDLLVRMVTWSVNLAGSLSAAERQKLKLDLFVSDAVLFSVLYNCAVLALERKRGFADPDYWVNFLRVMGADGKWQYAGMCRKVDGEWYASIRRKVPLKAPAENAADAAAGDLLGGDDDEAAEEEDDGGVQPMAMSDDEDDAARSLEVRQRDDGALEALAELCVAERLKVQVRQREDGVFEALKKLSVDELREVLLEMGGYRDEDEQESYDSTEDTSDDESADGSGGGARQGKKKKNAPVFDHANYVYVKLVGYTDADFCRNVRASQSDMYFVDGELSDAADSIDERPVYSVPNKLVSKSGPLKGKLTPEGWTKLKDVFPESALKGTFVTIYTLPVVLAREFLASARGRKYYSNAQKMLVQLDHLPAFVKDTVVKRLCRATKSRQKARAQGLKVGPLKLKKSSGFEEGGWAWTVILQAKYVDHWLKRYGFPQGLRPSLKRPTTRRTGCRLDLSEPGGDLSVTVRIDKWRRSEFVLHVPLFHPVRIPGEERPLRPLNIVFPMREEEKPYYLVKPFSVIPEAALPVQPERDENKLSIALVDYNVAGVPVGIGLLVLEHDPATGAWSGHIELKDPFKDALPAAEALVANMADVQSLRDAFRGRTPKQEAVAEKRLEAANAVLRATDGMLEEVVDEVDAPLLPDHLSKNARKKKKMKHARKIKVREAAGPNYRVVEDVQEEQYKAVADALGCAVEDVTEDDVVVAHKRAAAVVKTAEARETAAEARKKQTRDAISRMYFGVPYESDAVKAPRVGSPKQRARWEVNWALLKVINARLCLPPGSPAWANLDANLRFKRKEIVDGCAAKQAEARYRKQLRKSRKFSRQMREMRRELAAELGKMCDMVVSSPPDVKAWISRLSRIVSRKSVRAFTRMAVASTHTQFTKEARLNFGVRVFEPHEAYTTNSCLYCHRYKKGTFYKRHRKCPFADCPSRQRNLRLHRELIAVCNMFIATWCQLDFLTRGRVSSGTDPP